MSPPAGSDHQVGWQRISARVVRSFPLAVQPRPDQSGDFSPPSSASNLVRTGRSSVWTLRLGT
jgi:hypothetical protein